MMDVKSFSYKKGNGERSDRKVMVTEDHVDHIIAIDLGHLSASQQSSLSTIARASTSVNMADYGNAIRRFQKNNMTNIKDISL